MCYACGNMPLYSPTANITVQFVHHNAKDQCDFAGIKFFHHPYSFLSDRECCFLLHVHLKPNSYLALHVHKYQEVQLDKFNFNFSTGFGFQRLSKRNNYDQPNPFHRFLFCAPVHFHPPHNLQTHSLFISSQGDERRASVSF